MYHTHQSPSIFNFLCHVVHKNVWHCFYFKIFFDLVLNNTRQAETLNNKSVCQGGPYWTIQNNAYELTFVIIFCLIIGRLGFAKYLFTARFAKITENLLTTIFAM